MPKETLYMETLIARWVGLFHPLALDDLITELRRLQLAKDCGNAEEIEYHKNKLMGVADKITNPIF